MTAIIFDIDGTLIESMKFDSKIYSQAVKKVLGDVFIYDDWGKYNNVTDPGILNQIIKENYISEAKQKAFEVRKYFGELISLHLRHQPCKPKKGAIEAINNLAAHQNYVVGYATGGWGHTAIMKLKSANLFNNDIQLFSGDHHHERVNIMKLCKDHISPLKNDIVYVGDAPWDLEATSKLGWGFIGIGERLKNIAEVWIADFLDTNWMEAPIKALHMTGR
jgi:phosphoglycolate phosphatase-like HAD superfamily hydrolase